jgi:hypothetical protein
VQSDRTLEAVDKEAIYERRMLDAQVGAENGIDLLVKPRVSRSEEVLKRDCSTNANRLVVRAEIADGLREEIVKPTLLLELTLLEFSLTLCALLRGLAPYRHDHCGDGRQHSEEGSEIEQSAEGARRSIVLMLELTDLLLELLTLELRTRRSHSRSCGGQDQCPEHQQDDGTPRRHRRIVSPIALAAQRVAS